MDNISVTPGSGVTVAGDDIGGVLHQRVKLTLGNDGVNDGDISTTNPMPVNIVGGVELEFKNDSGNPLPISGTVTANTGLSQPLTDAQLRATAVPVSGTVSISGSVSTTGGLTDTQLRATPVPVSGTVTANTGLTQPLTDTQLRATAVPVSGTVTSNAGTGTFAVSAASLPLPTGASTSALQTTGNSSLSSIDTKTPALGQALAAASTPVVLTAAQITTLTPLSTITANAGTGTFAISAASLPLPTGAATSALQTTGNSSLSSIDTKTPALGQALMAASQPVTIASNQSAIPVTGSFSLAGGSSVQITDGSSTLALVKESDNYANSMHGILAMGVDDSSPTRKIRPLKTNADGDLYVHVEDGIGNPITSTTISTTQALDVNIANTVTANIGTIAGIATETTLSSINSKTPVLVSGRQPVDGSGVTQPISAVSLPLPTGASTAAGQTTINATLGSPMQNSGGSVTANAGTNLNTSALALESGGNLASINTKTPALTTKNVQAVNLQPTINITDTGRNITNYFMVSQTISTNTDTLMSLTGYKSGATVVATTTPAVVTAGKTYRITSIVVTYIAITTAGTVHFTLRANTGGVVAIGSPAVCEYTVGATSTTSGVAQTVCISIPEGMEFAAGTGVGISMQGFSSNGTASAVGYGLCKIMGYEY